MRAERLTAAGAELVQHRRRQRAARASGALVHAAKRVDNG